MRLRVRSFFASAAVLAGLAHGPAGAQETVLFFQAVEWSPDGTRLLVSVIERKPDWSDYAPEKWKLFVVGLDTGALRQIETGSSFAMASRSCGPSRRTERGRSG